MNLSKSLRSIAFRACRMCVYARDRYETPHLDKRLRRIVHSEIADSVEPWTARGFAGNNQDRSGLAPTDVPTQPLDSIEHRE